LSPAARTGPRPAWRGRGAGPNVGGWAYGCLVATWDAARKPFRKLLRHHSPGWRSPFRRIDFVVVDLETTGWSPGEAQITEIGAVRVSGGRLRGRFSSLVNPGSAIPEQVAALTGISDSMVAAAPPLAQVLAGFLDFAGGAVLTAHNAPFDVAFLTAACRDCGQQWPEFQVLDTVDLAHRVLADGEVPDCKLATLAGFFGARTQPRHRALPDALATADVLGGLLRRLYATGARTLAEAGVSTLAGAAGGWRGTLPPTGTPGGICDHRDRADTG
jgi:DNA polymerase III epsilon subunit family exonuclease